MIGRARLALLTALGFWSFAFASAPLDVTASLATALQAPVIHCGSTALVGERLAPFYATDAPVAWWLAARGPNARAHALRHALQHAAQEGLAPGAYRVDEIAAHWSGSNPAEQACLELLLTAAFDRYSRDVRRGVLHPQDADPTWQLRPPAFDPVAALQAVTRDEDFTRLLLSLPPAHVGYQRLKNALWRYRQFVEEGGWSALPTGPALAPGAVHDQVPALRARLRREGDLSRFALSFGVRYDTALVKAVRQFQRRNGLEDDGIVGAHTRAALNVPATERVAQLRRAMERLRWLPHDPGPHYILVNTAGFELHVVEYGQTVLTMRTINGTLDQATPSFSATLQTLIINPYWYVPKRIAHDRLWPRQRNNPGYFAAHGFRVFDTANGRWQEIDPADVDPETDRSTLRVRQDPGPGNLMGRLSFVFPNPFDVFLHDTPERALFARTTRTFSEGCVRIEDAMALALHVLRRLPEWDEARIRAEIDALHHLNLPLPEPIPVYVLYLPSWVDDVGRVQFRGDPYQREAVLAGHDPAR